MSIIIMPDIRNLFSYLALLVVCQAIFLKQQQNKTKQNNNDKNPTT